MILNKQFEHAPITKLKVHPKNPNTGDVESLAESIRENGFYGYVIANKKSKEVLVGNHRFEAAKEAGMATIPTIWVEVNAKTEAWLLAKDNEIAHNGHRDVKVLDFLLNQLYTLRGTGYTEDDLEDMKTELRRMEPEANAAPSIKASEEDVQRYTDNGLYYISLDFTPSEYAEGIKRFDDLMTKHKAESYAEAWLRECTTL